MKISVTELLFGLSTALDAVEGALIGATTYHAQRVAFLSSKIGRAFNFTDYERLCVAVASVLHDNALTQFAQSELFKGVDENDIDIESNLGQHCAMGESNVKLLPIYKDIKGAVLYHHERADGSGPFGKMPNEIPLYARIVHIADRVDVIFDLTTIDEEKYKRLIRHVQKGRGTVYDEEVCKAFLQAMTYDVLKSISGVNIVSTLYEEIPTMEKDYSSNELIMLSDMFARIIDFKSPFTTRHSRGIAQKARMMGEYYNMDENVCKTLYFAGAVHDVGKLFVDNDILEKPGKLTAEEFKQIQDHASGTYVVLNSISGLGDVINWASLHHEKLDGSGYPFGKTGDELSKEERLMACIDIYQALVESRPYKAGMSHEKTMSILYDMANNNKIDMQITKDIDDCFKDWVEPSCEEC